MSRPGFASLLLALLTGCGDGVVDGHYPGEALFDLAGVVVYDVDVELPDAPLYVTILWERESDDGYTYEPALAVDTTFPARYRITIYAPPPESTYEQANEHAPLQAIGAVVLFADEDGDASYDPEGDPLVGGSDEVVLVYVAEASSVESDPNAPPEGEGPERLELEVGFHALQFDGGCPGDGEVTEVDPNDVDLYISSDAYVPLFDCDGR